MKRTIAMIIALCLILGLVAGCGAQSDQTISDN